MASKVTNSPRPDIIQNPAPSKWKEYGFVIAMIVLIGIAIGGVGVGVAGYFHVGALSPLKHLHAFIIMGASGGTLLLGVIGGICFFVFRNRPKNNSLHDSAPPKVVIEQPAEEDFSYLVYGEEAWQKLGARVLGRIPHKPDIDWNENDPYFNAPFKKNYILIYIPNQVGLPNIYMSGKIKVEPMMDLETLKLISNTVVLPDGDYVGVCKTERIRSGWRLMSTKIIPKSESKTRAEHLKQHHETQSDGYRMPYLIEVIACKLLTGSSPADNYSIRCQDTYSGRDGTPNGCALAVKNLEVWSPGLNDVTYNTLCTSVCKDLN